MDDARRKAFRGPVLIMAVADLRAEQPEVHALERVVSLGAAIQNLLLAAQARGYGSGLSSGRALQSPLLREAFGIAEGEHAVCFISLGTPLRSKSARQRPAVDAFVRRLSERPRTAGMSDDAAKNARKAGSADHTVDDSGRTAGSTGTSARRKSIVVSTAGVRRFWQDGSSLSRGLVSVMALSTAPRTISSDTPFGSN